MRTAAWMDGVHAVYVEELVAGGAADKTGAIAVGDVLSKCSAVVLKARQLHVPLAAGAAHANTRNRTRLSASIPIPSACAATIAMPSTGVHACGTWHVLWEGEIWRVCMRCG